jgi:uncharacterized phosphatase
VLLYLVRHGETDWNRLRRIQGRTDIPLNDTGRHQALATSRLLARREWDAIISSPLSRALETASIIAAKLGLPAPVANDALVERNYGDAEGLEDTELDRRFPGDTPVPGREEKEDLVARVLPALLEIADQYPDQAVIVVSHGGVIRSVLNAVDPGKRHPSITNGSVHSFLHENGTLSLIAFDDPIEDFSLEAGTDELDQQNAVEAREHR